MKAVAPKTSPVRPPNLILDILPIKKTTININTTPNKILTIGKIKYIGKNQSIIAIINFEILTFLIILPVLENLDVL